MDKIEVYHGGTDRIEHPDCSVGRPDLDFGQGFYVTDIYEQAHRFAQVKAATRHKPGLLNVYLLDRKGLLQEGCGRRFDYYDAEWLEFIVACRSGKGVWRDYDYIEGGVADDRVIDTVNMYMQGNMTQEAALHRLRYLKPNNQICITNQSLLDKYLKFIECKKIDENG